jgi:hypothetical protein
MGKPPKKGPLGVPRNRWDVKLNVCHPHCVESKIQCVKLCAYSHIHTVKTQQICCVLTVCICEYAHNFIHCMGR